MIAQVREETIGDAVRAHVRSVAGEDAKVEDLFLVVNPRFEHAANDTCFAGVVRVRRTGCAEKEQIVWDVALKFDERTGYLWVCFGNGFYTLEAESAEADFNERAASMLTRFTVR